MLYASTNNAFGTMPERILELHFKLLPPGSPVLDIGAGQGRNSLFLARSGIEVDSIDPSRTAIKILKETARLEKLPLRARQCTFQDFSTDRKGYGGFLLFGLLPMLEWRQIDDLVEALDAWGCPSSLLFITAFTTADPEFTKMSRFSKYIGRNSFRDEYGQTWTYLEPGELLTLFLHHEVVYHWEGEGPEHRHGNGPKQKHGMVEAVLRRS